jgi:hypothetical protein
MSMLDGGWIYCVSSWACYRLRTPGSERVSGNNFCHYAGMPVLPSVRHGSQLKKLRGNMLAWSTVHLPYDILDPSEWLRVGSLALKEKSL